MAMTPDDWKSIILREADDDGVVLEIWDSIWERRASYDEADPSGELRHFAVLRDALDLRLATEARRVTTSDGGGKSGQWDQYWDHISKLREQAQADFKAQQKAVISVATMDVSQGVMTNYSLTPTPTGYYDPSSPGYAGDPRYRRLGGPWRTP